jgi:hypothetical protein
LSGRFGTGVQLPSAPLLAAANSYGFARGVFIFAHESNCSRFFKKSNLP